MPMRISVKGRYALAAAVLMAEKHDSGECTTISSISDRLGTSKIYMEQVFSMLKHGNVVKSIKGSRGGYQLTRMPSQLTALHILSAVELSLFESTEPTVQEKMPEVDQTMRTFVFAPLDESLKDMLESITLSDLVAGLEHKRAEQNLMFYI